MVLFGMLFVSAWVQAAPSVQNGVFDLTGWDRHSAVGLEGNWDFFPSGSPDAPAGSTARSLKVPGAWNPVLGRSEGWGTYRLQVVLSDPPPADLALALPLINSASEVLWNGTTVWKTGNWGPDRQAFRPEARTGVVDLVPRPGTNELLIRVANWGDVNGGLTESLHLGTLTGLLTDRNGDVAGAVFLFGCLFVMGLYHLGLFFFRTQDRSPLWFGLLSILLAVRGLVYGSDHLADLVPGLDWELWMKLGFLTFSVPVVLLVLFITDLFPRQSPRWVRPAAVVGGGLYSLAVLVVPAAWYTQGLYVFQGFAAVLAVLVAFVLVRAAGREPGAPLVLAGFVLFFAAAAYDIVKTTLFLPTPFLAPVGLLLLLIFQSLVILKKFTTALSESERSTRRLEKLNSSLERFIPREMLSFLNKQSIVEVELGDHCEQPMTVMFADIRDFTTLSESMTPGETFRFINSYLERMGPVVRRHGGFIDKYLGDGIMALFPGDPRNAIEAALDLRATLAEYNDHRGKSSYPPIRMGMGIHRGVLMLGTIGENQRMDSTVISDTVNAASRIEGLTKKFGRDILISGETVESLGLDVAADYRLEYIDEETVKGRRRPVKVYSLNHPGA
jgi:adenylate cyclase